MDSNNMLMNPQEIVSAIDQDFRKGDISPVPLFIEVRVHEVPKGEANTRFFCENWENGADSLLPFLFDLSLSHGICGFERVNIPSEIAMNGFDDAVVGYSLMVDSSAETNITPDLMEYLVGVLDAKKKQRELGWDSQDFLEENANGGGWKCN